MFFITILSLFLQDLLIFYQSFAQESIQQRIEEFQIQVLEDSDFYAEEILKEILKLESKIWFDSILVDERKWSFKELNAEYYNKKSQLEKIESLKKQYTIDVESLIAKKCSLIVSNEEVKKQDEQKQQITIEKQKQEIEEQILLQDYKDKIELKDVALKQCEGVFKQLLTSKPPIENLQTSFHNFSLSRWKKDDLSSLKTQFEKTINPLHQLFKNTAYSLDFIQICMLEEDQWPREESKQKDQDSQLPQNQIFSASECYSNQEYYNKIINNSSQQQNSGRNNLLPHSHHPYNGNSHSESIAINGSQSSEIAQQSSSVNLPPKSKARIILSNLRQNIYKGLNFPVAKFSM